MNGVNIRHAEHGDVPALLDVYNYYVTHTHITFDIEPRSLEQRQAWFAAFANEGRYQCFVAERGGLAIGWASSGRFKDRAGYDTSVETSVYLRPGEDGKGVGRGLYTALFESIRHADIRRAFGGIALPNEASVRLHERLGFRLAGTYTEVGRKFGRFWDVAWYERSFV